MGSSRRAPFRRPGSTLAGVNVALLIPGEASIVFGSAPVSKDRIGPMQYWGFKRLGWVLCLPYCAKTQPAVTGP